MRYATNDPKELADLKAAPWMLALLAINPGYCSWGNFEDYMSGESDHWDGRIEFATFAEMFTLDDLNECVNFYFEVSRESKECPDCGGNGYHADAQQIVRTFYRHSCQRGEVAWNDNITDDEAQALIDDGRAKPGTTASEINEAQKPGAGIGHDAINRHILIKARAERLGIEPYCTTCNGDGYVHTADHATVALQLWILHPRKGCSRGVFIKDIQESDLPAVFAFLRGAAERNADRFGRIPAGASQEMTATEYLATLPSAGGAA